MKVLGGGLCGILADAPLRASEVFPRAPARRARLAYEHGPKSRRRRGPRGAPRPAGKAQNQDAAGAGRRRRHDESKDVPKGTGDQRTCFSTHNRSCRFKIRWSMRVFGARTARDDAQSPPQRLGRKNYPNLSKHVMLRCLYCPMQRPETAHKCSGVSLQREAGSSKKKVDMFSNGGPGRPAALTDICLTFWSRVQESADP